MPRIPDYNAQRDAVFNITTPNVVGEVYGAGAALKDVGRVLDKGADLVQQYAESQEMAKATKDLADIYGQWDAHLQDRKNNAEPGAPDFTSAVLKDYDDNAKRTVENFSTPKVRQFIDERLSNHRLSIQNDALNFQAASGLQYKVDTATQATRVYANTLVSNPALLDQSLENLTIAIDNIGLPASKKGEFLQKAQATLVESAVGGLAEKNPQQALKNLNDGLYDTQIDPNTKASLIARAQSRIDLGDQRFQNEIEQKLKDRKAMILTGAVSPTELPPIPQEALQKAYPEKKYPGVAKSIAYQQNLQNEIGFKVMEATGGDEKAYVKTYQELLSMKNSPEEENAAIRIGVVSEALKEMDNFKKALNNSPAALVLQYDQSVQNARSHLADDIPDEPVVFQSYAKTSIAAQKMRGVPDNKLQILDEQLLGGVTAELQAAKDGRSLTNILETQAAQWGEYWPIAVRQIGKELEPGYQTVIGTSEKENTNNMLGRLASGKAYVFPRSDIATALKQLPANKNTVPATDQKVIKDAIQGDAGDLKVFMDSIPSSFEAANIRDDTQAAISAYALFLRAQKGVDASTAASQAVVGVINSRYALVNTDEIKARIPRSVNVSSTKVEKGAEILKQTVPNLKVNIPKDTDEAAFFEELVNGGVWKTSSGDEGLVLIDATDSPVFYAELGADGRPRPVQFTWAQIAEQAKKGEAEIVKRRGELEKMKQKIQNAPSTDPQVDRFGMPM
jgi:hypothetical protein